MKENDLKELISKWKLVLSDIDRTREVIAKLNNNVFDDSSHYLKLATERIESKLGALRIKLAKERGE